MYMKIEKFIIFMLWILFCVIVIIWVISVLESLERRWKILWDTHLKIWEYKLWKQMWGYNICKKWEWCLHWEVKWLKQVKDDIYIYMYVKCDQISWQYIRKALKREPVDCDYYLFDWKNDIDIKNFWELPKFWYLSWDNVEFYSENDMENLSEEKQKIFRDLELNPKVIVNGVDYTRKKVKKVYSWEANF